MNTLVTCFHWLETLELISHCLASSPSRILGCSSLPISIQSTNAESKPWQSPSFAPNNLHPVRVALERSALVKQAKRRSQFNKNAFLRSADSKFAPLAMASEKLALQAMTLFKSQLDKTQSSKLAFDRLESDSAERLNLESHSVVLTSTLPVRFASFKLVETISASESCKPDRSIPSREAPSIHSLFPSKPLLSNHWLWSLIEACSLFSSMSWGLSELMCSF